MRPRCLKCGSLEVKEWSGGADCRCGFSWVGQTDDWPESGNPMGYRTVDRWGNPYWEDVPGGCMAVWGENE